MDQELYYNYAIDEDSLPIMIRVPHTASFAYMEHGFHEPSKKRMLNIAFLVEGFSRRSQVFELVGQTKYSLDVPRHAIGLGWTERHNFLFAVPVNEV